MKKISVFLFIILCILFLSSCPGTDSDTDPTPEPTPGNTSEATPDGTPEPTAEVTSAPTAEVTSEPTETPVSTIPPNLTYDLNTDPSGDGWSVGATNCDWEWGTVSSVGPTESVCYGTVIDGDYSHNMTYAENYVQLGPLDLSEYTTSTGFQLTFDAYFDLDYDYDRTQLQYSTDGSNFDPVESTYVSGYPYTYTSTHEWSPNPSMETPQWLGVVVDIGGMGLNAQSSVSFRWVLNSDNSPGFEYPGFYIDNIEIGY